MALLESPKKWLSGKEVKAVIEHLYRSRNGGGQS